MRADDRQSRNMRIEATGDGTYGLIDWKQPVWVQDKRTYHPAYTETDLA
ncbi:hypothetical protein [Caenibius sp. WL]|nr:hypothetical protein [Caenibius sp. WL]